MHSSDTDTKTRDPVRALNNSPTAKLMLGEVCSSGLSGGRAIHMSPLAGKAEEVAECRDGGVHVVPRRCRFAWMRVCARMMRNAYTQQVLTRVGRHVLWWYEYV